MAALWAGNHGGALLTVRAAARDRDNGGDNTKIKATSRGLTSSYVRATVALIGEDGEGGGGPPANDGAN